MLKMCHRQGELDVLARPPVNGLDARRKSETVTCLPKSRGIGIGREAIQPYLMEQERRGVEQIIPPLRAAEAAALMSHEHLLTKRRDKRNCTLLRELEAQPKPLKRRDN